MEGSYGNLKTETAVALSRRAINPATVFRCRLNVASDQCLRSQSIVELSPRTLASTHASSLARGSAVSASKP